MQKKKKLTDLSLNEISARATPSRQALRRAGRVSEMQGETPPPRMLRQERCPVTALHPARCPNSRASLARRLPADKKKKVLAAETNIARSRRRAFL